MHHFIYPQQDTYITNRINYPNKNFGLDESLLIGTKDITNKFSVPTKTFIYNNEYVSNWCVGNFSGSVISASFVGTASYISGSGNGTGSLGIIPFSGSSILIGSTFSGSLTNFYGTLGDFGGHITATITGTQSFSQSHDELIVSKYVNRTLIKFDINVISASISAGDIPMPDFRLKFHISKAEELPIQYIVYTLPISQSWDMGNGYFSDDGSDKGASWNYRDYKSGSVWYPITDSSSFTPIDFIGVPSNAPLVWSRGGGTWYTNSISSQSFDYVTGDIDMDVTSTVTKWISGSIPNNGFILISSEELQPTGSEMGLYFFSQDSNTIFQPFLDVGWDDSNWITGSISTASVVIVNLPPGLLGVTQVGSTISGSSVNGGFNGTVNLVTTSSGALTGTGFSGSIKNLSFYGNIDYFLSASISASISQSLILGTLTSGQFSSSIFTASINSYLINGGQITGSWNNSQLEGSQISASYPFTIAPNIIVTISGNQVSGHALGTWQAASLTSGSFTGVMTDGLQAGAYVYIPFTGSILTASLSYTSSVILESSSLSPVQFSKPFVTVIQNLPKQANAGNIIRINVFAREEFPFKNFERRTQFTQFLTPQYLPTSSYYAIKDNETEIMILGFDDNTKLSCDEKGNYFLIDTTGLPQERYIRVLLKTEQSGSVYTFDHDDIVKIVR